MSGRLGVRYRCSKTPVILHYKEKGAAVCRYWFCLHGPIECCRAGEKFCLVAVRRFFRAASFVKRSCKAGS